MCSRDSRSLEPIEMSPAASDSITCYSGRDRDWHSAVLSKCPSLSGGFEPSLWVRNTHVQSVLTVVRGDGARAMAWDREERLTMPDGGTVSIQWLGLDAPAETPVLVVLHTITGSGDGLRRAIAAIQRRLGWVVAACNRRGHAGLELTAPRINTMGATDDLRSSAHRDRVATPVGRALRARSVGGLGLARALSRRRRCAFAASFGRGAVSGLRSS